QPDPGPADLHASAVAVPGDADDVLRVPAVDPAVGLHVPVRGHAEGGAMDRRGLAADAFPASDPRDHAAWRQPGGTLAGSAGAARVHGRHDDGGDPAVPQAAGLSALRRTGARARAPWRAG